MQDTEYRIQNTEHRIQNTEYRIQNAALAAGFTNPMSQSVSPFKLCARIAVIITNSFFIYMDMYMAQGSMADA